MTTIAIIDYAHCGTTMLAGILERLGVPMVIGGDPNGKKEDREIVKALHRGTLADVVRERDGLWGFKCPGAWKFDLSPLQKPVYLAIYKDPVSVTLRRFGRLTAVKMASTVHNFAASITGMREAGIKPHYLSYLRAIVGPVSFVCELADIVGIAPTRAQIVSACRYIEPGLRE